MYLLVPVLMCCKSTHEYVSGDIHVVINPQQIPAPSAPERFYSQCWQVSWMLGKKSLLTTILHRKHIMWSIFVFVFVLKNNYYMMFCYHRYQIAF